MRTHQQTCHKSDFWHRIVEIIESARHANQRRGKWNMNPSVEVSSPPCAATKTFTTTALSDPTHTGLMDKSEVVEQGTTFRYHFQSLVRNPTCFPNMNISNTRSWGNSTLFLQEGFSYRWNNTAAGIKVNACLYTDRLTHGFQNTTMTTLQNPSITP